MAEGLGEAAPVSGNRPGRLVHGGAGAREAAQRACARAGSADGLPAPGWAARSAGMTTAAPCWDAAACRRAADADVDVAAARYAADRAVDVLVLAVDGDFRCACACGGAGRGGC